MRDDFDPNQLPKNADGVPIIQGPDGLSELDHPMPRWMALVFWGTFVWGLGYLVAYPGVGLSVLGWTQKGMYEAELAAAKTQFAAAPAPAAGTAGDATRGSAVFTAQCAACHGAGGVGSIGPSLTDKTWLYGGTPAAIAKTISDGTAKGMPPFKAGLSSGQVADLAAYVHGLGGGE